MSTKVLSQSKTLHIRIVLASLVGAASGFLIVFPSISAILLAIIKLLFSLLIVFIAFSKERFIKHFILFYVVNFLYAGLIEACLQFFSLPGIVFQNGILYFNLSAIRLCLYTVIAYGVLELVSLLFYRTTPIKQMTEMRICFMNKTVSTNVLLDTGNLTRDVLTGLPVAIFESTVFSSVFSASLLDNMLSLKLDQIEDSQAIHFHLIPMKSVGGSTILVGFQPDRCEIYQDGQWISCDAIIAVTKEILSNGEFHGIAPAKLIN